MNKIRKNLDYITKNEKGIKQWTIFFGITGVIMATVMTILFYSPEQTFIQNFLPGVSVPVGMLCVYLLGVRKNTGNVLGIIANVFETIINTSFGNFGFVVSAVYYGITHVFGFFDWRKNTDENNNAIIEKLESKRDIITLILVLVFSTVYVYVASINGWIDTGLSTFMYVANIAIMYIGIIAQGTMVLRYRFSWILWIIFNLIAIPVQFISGNYVFGVMYILYQINALISTYAQYTSENVENKELEME